MLPIDAFHVTKFEAKKHLCRQTVDGQWQVTLTLHPNDVPIWLVMAPQGTHLAVGVVAMIEGIEPGTDPSVPVPRTEGMKAVEQAALLCRQPEFQAFLATLNGDLLGILDGDPEELAAERLRDILAIASRAELRTNDAALRQFTDLVAEFYEEAKKKTEI